MKILSGGLSFSEQRKRTQQAMKPKTRTTVTAHPRMHLVRLITGMMAWQDEPKIRFG